MPSSFGKPRKADAELLASMRLECSEIAAPGALLDHTAEDAVLDRLGLCPPIGQTRPAGEQQWM